MNLILEFDGLLFDVQSACVHAHNRAANAVGWARMEAGAFWRRLRKRGPTADFLTGAKPLKQDEYRRRFAEQLETEDALAAATPHDGIHASLKALTTYGPCAVVTLGSNIDVRRRIARDARLADMFARMEALSEDPRRRPAELRALAAGDPRALVVASTDALIRAAGEAGLFTLGVPTGTCRADRLHQAGAAIVYRDLADLPASLARGAPDLIQAGLLPPSYEP